MMHSQLVLARVYNKNYTLGFGAFIYADAGLELLKIVQ